MTDHDGPPPIGPGDGSPSRRRFWSRLALLVVMLLLVAAFWVGVAVVVAHATPLPCTGLAHHGIHTATIDEETSESAAAAAGYGAWLDADLRVTSDHVAVLMHNRTVNETTNGNGRIEDHDAAWVAGLLTQPNAQRVPTWTEYLAAAGDTPIVAELKQDVAPWTDAEILAVADAAYGHEVYLGGAPAMLKRINEIAPAVATYWRPSLDDAVNKGTIAARSVEMVLAFPGSWTAGKVKRFEASGLVVGSRMGGGQERWAASWRDGVRLISTGNVAAFNDWCAER